MQIAKESADIINNTKNTDTFINRCKIALDVLNRLIEFEHLNLINPTPTKIIDDIIEKRNDTLFEHLSAYYFELNKKINDIDSTDRIIKIIEKAKTDFAKYEVYISNPEKLEEVKFYKDDLVNSFIIQKYNSLIRDASEYEKNGKVKLALKKLVEASKQFEKTKYYFPERDQNLEYELKEWIERLKNKFNS